MFYGEQIDDVVQIIILTSCNTGTKYVKLQLRFILYYSVRWQSLPDPDDRVLSKASYKLRCRKNIEKYTKKDVEMLEDSLECCPLWFERGPWHYARYGWAIQKNTFYAVNVRRNIFVGSIKGHDQKLYDPVIRRILDGSLINKTCLEIYLMIIQAGR